MNSSIVKAVLVIPSSIVKKLSSSLRFIGIFSLLTTYKVIQGVLQLKWPLLSATSLYLLISKNTLITLGKIFLANICNSLKNSYVSILFLGLINVCKTN